MLLIMVTYYIARILDSEDFDLEKLYISFPNTNNLKNLSNILFPKQFRSPFSNDRLHALRKANYESNVNLDHTHQWLNLMVFKEPKRVFQTEKKMHSRKGKSLPASTSKKSATVTILPPLHNTQQKYKPMSKLSLDNSKQKDPKTVIKRRSYSDSGTKTYNKSANSPAVLRSNATLNDQWKNKFPSKNKIFSKARSVVTKSSKSQSFQENKNYKKTLIGPMYGSQFRFSLKKKLPLITSKSLDQHEGQSYKRNFNIKPEMEVDNDVIIYDKEITNIETFFTGKYYSNSDPTLNQSTSLKELFRSFQARNKLAINIVSSCDEDSYESDTDVRKQKVKRSKFYQKGSSSSSSEYDDLNCSSLHKPFFSKNFPLKEIIERSISEKLGSGSESAATTPTLKADFSRRGSMLRGSLLHISPGSLPDIRLVPCSPDPSTKPSECNSPNDNVAQAKFEDIVNDMQIQPSFPSKLPSHSLPLVNSETSLEPSYSTTTSWSSDNSQSALSLDKVELSPSSSLCSSSSNSVFKLSMPVLQGVSEAPSGVYQSNSLSVLPAECSLVALSCPPRSSSPHSSSLSLHATHSFMDPSVEFSRTGFSSSTVSPKRGSRSRKTSASYSMSRSPQMQESVESAVASQSPTHSMKMASPSHTSGTFFNRRSSDSDLSITPKGGSLTGSGGSSGGRVGMLGPFGSCQKGMMSELFDNLIYPFLTMKKFPPEFIIHLGGTVSARSVKLLDRGHLPEEVDSRDSWWAQLRTEIRSHARSIACNVVLGYEEFTTICDEVCVLNASGTAAVINVCYQEMDNVSGLPSKNLKDPLSVSLEKKDFDAPNTKAVAKDSQVYLRLKASSPRPLRRLIQQSAVSRSHPNVIEDIGEGSGSGTSGVLKIPANTSRRPPYSPCTMCHIPYAENANPFNVKILKCAVCKKGKVPDVLLTTLEIPSDIPITGQGCLIQARVVRSKKDLKGELNAKEISDSLPFLEYELHKQLYQKIMIRGMNSLFGLRVRVTVGGRLVVGVGTGTALFLSALPPPPMPRVVISGAGGDEEKKRIEIQKRIQETFEKNMELYGLNKNENGPGNSRPLSESKSSDTEDSEEELLEFDLSSGNKDAYVLDLDDLEDVEMLKLLFEGLPPPHCFSVSTQTPPGFPMEQTVSNLQMFTRVWRSKIPFSPSRTLFSSYFEVLLQSIYFKIRNLSPCILSGLKVDVELPDEDELQISVFGMVLGQGKPAYLPSSKPTSVLQKLQELNIEPKTKQDDNDLMFTIEGLREVEEKPSVTASSILPLKAPSFVTHSCNVLSNALHRSSSSTQSFPSVPSAASISSGSSSGRSSLKVRLDRGDKRNVSYHLPPKADHFGVEITPLSFIPGARIEKYLGNLNFFFIRESTSIKENGGLSGFMGSFVTEVLALVRAHVSAIGGNAMISYFLSECILLHNPHKNQAQCLINVGGDIVHVIYSNSTSQHPEQTETAQQSNAEPLNSASKVITE